MFFKATYSGCDLKNLDAEELKGFRKISLVCFVTEFNLHAHVCT